MNQSNGGAHIDTSKLHRQFVPDYGISGPHRLRKPFTATQLCAIWLTVMAVILAGFFLAAGRG